MLKSVLNPLLFISAFCVLVTLVFPPIINSYAIVLWLIISLLSIVKSNDYAISKELLPSIIFFVIYAIGLIVANNLKEEYPFVVQHLPFLVFPLLGVSFTYLSADKKEKLLEYFAYFVALVGAVFIANAIYGYCISGTFYPTDKIGHFVHNRFMHHRLTAVFNLHAVYYSFFVSISSIVITHSLLFEKSLNVKKRALYLSLLLFFCLLIFLLKSAIFSFSLPLCILLLLSKKYLFSGVTPKRVLLFGLLTACVGLFSYNLVLAKLQNFDTKVEYKNEKLAPLAIRLGVWKSSMQLISTNPVSGIGRANSDKELLKQYEKNEFAIGIKSKFNAHNMFLQYAISNGLFGVICFTFLLIFYLIFAIKTNDFRLLSLVVLFSLFSLTESTMIRQKGIVGFLFFVVLLTSLSNSKKKSL